MKVKKNKLLILSISTLVLLLILFVAIVFLFAKYNVGINEGEIFLKNGLSTNPASLEKLKEYTSERKNDIDILHYDIHIELLPEDQEIIGDVTITGVVKKNNLENINLNFYDNYDISSVTLNKTKIDYQYYSDKLILPNSVSEKDTFLIRVKYKGEPESLGFGSFNFDKYNGSNVIYTLNEPIYASTWFPCNDTPTDKVQVDLSITNDSSMVSVSNGVLKDISTNKGKRTFHWGTKYPIATYLISIYSAVYTNFSDSYITSTGDTMSIDYYVFPTQLDEAKIDFKIHPKAIKYFAELFGEYPFVSEKYGVAEFMWKLGAMEHQSITGIGKNFITGRKFFTGMLVHELAHQWWGNAVTLKSWKDIWLNEGFATYSEALYWEKESGKSALKSTMNSYLTNFNKSTLYNPKEIFGRLVYNKGAWVLHMLRKKVGDEHFFAILKTYYNNYKFKNASTNDFINISEKISKKNLTQFFKQWVFEGKGKIKLEYKFENEFNKNGQVVDINIKQIQKEYKNYKFQLDVELFFENGTSQKREVNIQSNDTVLTFPVEQKVVNAVIDPDNWLAAEIRLVN
jgi:aminopeptidase N